MAPQLTVRQRQTARRLKAAGWTLREIGAHLDCSAGTVGRLLEGAVVRPGRPDAIWQPAPGRLTLEEREEISLGIHRGESLSAISRELGRSASTVTREVTANGGREHYRAWRAHRRAHDAARRPKTAKLACPRLAAQVTAWLQEWWSPEEIAQRLRLEFPDDPMMRVSHETIYQSLFVQGRGELRRELTRCLRTGRATRRPRSRTSDGRGHLPGMVLISDRPAEVDDRAVPGHWEGDLLIGKNNRSAVGTLVERSTRYVLLVHLPDGYDAVSVETAMRHAITKLPSELFRTITWDRGKEMARHAEFSVATGVQIYFCDPHSPWQRGTNENTNGLLRQYMPKGTDLSVFTEDDLDRFARSLNNRPRKTLDYLKPSERLAELLALTG